MPTNSHGAPAEHLQRLTAKWSVSISVEKGKGAPIPKKKLPVGVGDFRPISILCALAKILESIAHDQIIKYLTRNDILDHFQSSFRKFYSTQTALLKIVDDLREAIDKESIALLVGVDHSRAFDVMNMNLAAEKLLTKDFSDEASNWVHSSLSGRSQYVELSDGTMSDELASTLGVAQSSPLGPLIYALTINDFGSAIKYCEYYKYADDAYFYLINIMRETR